MTKLIASKPFYLAMNVDEATAAGVPLNDVGHAAFVEGQDIPDALANHWYVKALMADGAVTEAPSAKETKAKSTG